VMTVVGCNGGASGGGFGEHGGGCPLVTAEPGLPVAAASAGELGEAAPGTCFAVWVQPATPATRTAASAAGRVKRNFHANIGVTVLKPVSFLKSLVQRVRSCRKKHMTASVRTHRPALLSCRTSPRTSAPAAGSCASPLPYTLAGQAPRGLPEQEPATTVLITD